MSKIRYLVMNRTNEVVAPRDEMLAGFDPAALKASGEIPKKFSPSFKNKGTAQKFAGALAAKYGGQTFYVAQVIGGSVATNVTWSDAVAGELHDDALADTDEDDDAPNE
jgi:hypothetical protein